MPVDLSPLTGPKPRLSTQPMAFIRALDADGTFEAGAVKIGPDGNPLVQIARASYVSADELVELICIALRPLVRQAVRDEFDALGLVEEAVQSEPAVVD